MSTPIPSAGKDHIQLTIDELSAEIARLQDMIQALYKFRSGAKKKLPTITKADARAIGGKLVRVPRGTGKLEKFLNRKIR